MEQRRFLSPEAFLGFNLKAGLHMVTVYNETTNVEEMGLTVQLIRELLGAMYLKTHNILCMVVQNVQETLGDVQ